MGELRTIKETAPRLLMAEVTLRRMIRRGECPYHRIGKKYFFTPDDIEKIISDCAVPPTKGANG
jgi:excisionase family DNA binding protein